MNSVPFIIQAKSIDFLEKDISTKTAHNIDTIIMDFMLQSVMNTNNDTRKIKKV